MIDDFKVTTGTLSTTDFFANHFSIFPNPASAVLNIAAKNVSETFGITEVKVTDMCGRTVKRIHYPGQIKIEMDITDLNTGTYFMAIKTNNGSTVTRFLKH